MEFWKVFWARRFGNNEFNVTTVFIHTTAVVSHWPAVSIVQPAHNNRSAYNQHCQILDEIS